MPVTLQLAMQLPKLRHLTVREAAARLGRSETEIREACQMLLMPMAPDEVEPPRLPDTDERAAARANWPMKWQQRYEKARMG